MTDPTITDLYLAWRQAKTALFYERRGVGSIELAQFEDDLPGRLASLIPKLTGGQWFDKLDIGEVWIVPKRQRDKRKNDNTADSVIRIGTEVIAPPPDIDVQLRLSPNPEFAIAEVLYLRLFGPALDTLLADESIGYRLDLKKGKLDPHRRWIFEFWPTRYQQFRTEPLRAAERYFIEAGWKSEHRALAVICADLASFYDSVDPAFLLQDDLLERLRGAQRCDITEYVAATRSLLAAYAQFRQVATRRLGLPVTTGLPIGALTSRVVANVALLTLDSHLRGLSGVVAYRRYVDDITLVIERQDVCSQEALLEQILPLAARGEDRDTLRLDVQALHRPGCEFQLQNEKVRVHHLRGEPGEDFLAAVLKDFDELVSRSEAFIDSTTLIGDGLAKLVSAANGLNSPLRVLRDADRVRLERFELSTSLRTLERATVLLDLEEVRELVRKTVTKVERLIRAETDWIESMGTALRLFCVALRASDYKSCIALHRWMLNVCESVASLRRGIGQLYYRKRPIELDRESAWVWLRNFLHQRIMEACASAVRLDTPSKVLGEWMGSGLCDRSRRLGPVAVLRRAGALARADMRMCDREEDDRSSPEEQFAVWSEEPPDDLVLRFALIQQFVERCNDNVSQAWRIPPERLFLATRPPSYFDVARRMLSPDAEGGFAANVFQQVMGVVNALRGTKYRSPDATVVDEHTVHLPWVLHGGRGGRLALPEEDPILVLGNLVIPDSWWKDAAKRSVRYPGGKPMLTATRLNGLKTVLAQAAEIARKPAEGGGRRKPTLLVLPELAVPQKWFGSIARWVVRHGHFGAVMGLEYLHVPGATGGLGHVLNQAHCVVPGRFASVATFPFTKGWPADGENRELRNLKLTFPPPTPDRRQMVVRTSWGSFSVLICSELIEATRVAALFGKAELILCPAWNTDTASYDHLVQSVGFQLHAIVAIANNGYYSDCRAWAPYSERWRRDLCRLIERDVNDTVHVDLPMKKLIAFHDDELFEPTAEERRKCKGSGCEPKKPEWRPLPPGWPLRRGHS